LDSNKDRYGYTREDEDGKPTGETEPGRIYTLGSKFQGAIVEARKFGYINNLVKVDFSSYYPSAIRTWNLGPILLESRMLVNLRVSIHSTEIKLT